MGERKKVAATSLEDLGKALGERGVVFDESKKEPQPESLGAAAASKETLKKQAEAELMVKIKNDIKEKVQQLFGSLDFSKAYKGAEDKKKEKIQKSLEKVTGEIWDKIASGDTYDIDITDEYIASACLEKLQGSTLGNKTAERIILEKCSGLKDDKVSKPYPVVEEKKEKISQARKEAVDFLAGKVDAILFDNRISVKKGEHVTIAEEILDGDGKDILTAFEKGKAKRVNWTMDSKDKKILIDFAKKYITEKYPAPEKEKKSGKAGISHTDVHEGTGKKKIGEKKTDEDLENEMAGITDGDGLLQYLKKIDTVRVFDEGAIRRGVKYPGSTDYYVTQSLLNKTSEALKGKLSLDEIKIPAIRKKLEHLMGEKTNKTEKKEAEPKHHPDFGYAREYLKYFKEGSIKRIENGQAARYGLNRMIIDNDHSRRGSINAFIKWREFSAEEKKFIGEYIKKANEEITAAWKAYENKGGKEDGKNFESANDREKMQEIERARAGSEITFALIENYEDLNADTESDGDKKFLEKTRELWKDFVVHGRSGDVIDKKTGKLKVKMETDLDGLCSLGLLKIAGFEVVTKYDNKRKKGEEKKKETVEFVNPGEYRKLKINIDTGNQDGVVVEDDAFFIDHHGEDSKRNVSATKLTYETLVAMGLLKREKYLDNLVNFVTEMDNGRYPQVEKYLSNSHKTIAGLSRFLNFSKLAYFFKNDRNPDPARELSEAEMKKYGIITSIGDKEINYSSRQREANEKSREKLEWMEKNGLIVETRRYGKIAIDLANGNGGKEIPGGYLAARSFGCEAYVIWNPEGKSFFVTSRQPITDKFSQGRIIRETMLIKPRHDDSELTMALGEVLEKMTDGNLKATGKLKEFLDKETGREKKQSTSEKQVDPEKEKREKYKQLIEECIGWGEKYKAWMIKYIPKGFVDINLEGLDEKQKDEKIQEEFVKRFGDLMKEKAAKYNYSKEDTEFVVKEVFNNLLNKK